jgi:hypothetical protein
MLSISPFKTKNSESYFQVLRICISTQLLRAQIACCTLIVFSAHATVNLTGKVINMTGDAESNVTVALKDSGLSSTTEFYWGDDMSEATMKKCAEYNTKFSSQTEHVASREPNAFGLYDMSGNISERVHDWINTYPSEEQIDPIGPMKGDPEAFVMKGGGFRHPEPKYIQSAIRWYSDNPITGGHEERHHSIGPYGDKYCRPGFRVARGLIPGKEVQSLKPDKMKM